VEGAGDAEGTGAAGPDAEGTGAGERDGTGVAGRDGTGVAGLDGAGDAEGTGGRVRSGARCPDEASAGTASAMPTTAAAPPTTVARSLTRTMVPSASGYGPGGRTVVVPYTHAARRKVA
jgi:hypothetical protein